MLDETKNFAKFIKNFPVHCTDAAREYISPPDSKNSLSNLVQDMRTYIEIQGLDIRNFDTLIAPGVEDIERKLKWLFFPEQIKSQILPILEEMMSEWHRATRRQRSFYKFLQLITDKELLLQMQIHFSEEVSNLSGKDFDKRLRDIEEMVDVFELRMVELYGSGDDKLFEHFDEHHFCWLLPYPPMVISG